MYSIENRILPFDTEAALQAASLAPQRQLNGRPVDFRDTQIAGIAQAPRHIGDVQCPALRGIDSARVQPLGLSRLCSGDERGTKRCAGPDRGSAGLPGPGRCTFLPFGNAGRRWPLGLEVGLGLEECGAGQQAKPGAGGHGC